MAEEQELLESEIQKYRHLYDSKHCYHCGNHAMNSSLEEWLKNVASNVNE